MSNISVDNFAKELKQNLTIYENTISRKINDTGESLMQKMVKLTKANAPVGKRKGRYRHNITYSSRYTKRGMRAYTWHVKGKDYRLTHLLMNGHATKNGGRTKGNPFLKNAVDKVIPEYERAVEEVLKGDK